MSPLTERVGCAIATALMGRTVTPSTVWDAGPSSERGKPVWKHYETAANAAIVAMREPTKAMIEAATPR